MFSLLEMARLRGTQVLLLVIIIFGQGDNYCEARSACSTPKSVILGGSAKIRFLFLGDFESDEIVVYKRGGPGLPVKIADCYFQALERLCEARRGFNFTLMSDNGSTEGILVIKPAPEQATGDYVCHTLNPPKRFAQCDLPELPEEPEVNTQPAFREGGHSPDKTDSPNRTGSDQTSTLSPGAIAGIVVAALNGFAVAVAVAVVVVKKRKQTCCKKRGRAANLTVIIGGDLNWSEKGDRAPCKLTTIEGGFASSEKGGLTPCISPTTEGDDTLSGDSSQEFTTPLMKDKTDRPCSNVNAEKT